MSRRLLVATDGSAHAQCALSEAIQLARADNAALTIMTVVPRPNAWALGGGFGTPVSLDHVNHEIERGHQDMLDAAVEAVPRDVPVTALVRHGPAGSAIVEEATAGNYDQIVMGSRGRSGLHSLLLGSVSHHVLHSSPVPVLLVHATAGGLGNHHPQVPRGDGDRERASALIDG